MEKFNFEENYSDPGAGFIAAAVGAGFYFWNQMNRTMYEPGHINVEQNLRNPLSPPAQTSPAIYWTVEPDIQLYHFSEGEGKNVLVIHGGPGQPYSEGWPGLEMLTDDFKFLYYDQRGSGKRRRVDGIWYILQYRDPS